MDPYLGEIRIFAGNFAPVGWFLCNGQLLPISQYTALFSILGTNYGGNGTSNFGLPNLQNSVPVMAGQGAGLSIYTLGQVGGQPSVTLTAQQVASHNHSFKCGSGGRGEVAVVTGNVNSDAAALNNIYATAADATVMNPAMISPTSPSQPHENQQPYLGLTFIIAFQGVFPPRG